jgi:hypothetical protein
MFSKHKLRLLGLACLLLCLAQETAAQIGGVSGTVVNEKNEPVAGALVMAKGDYIKSVRTKDNGDFRLTLRPGRWVLTVKKKGFRDQRVEASVEGYVGTASLSKKIVLSTLK